MTVIYETPYGSRLYGTEIATSDSDRLFVFVPKYDDLLLQRKSAYQSKQVTTINGDDNTFYPIAQVINGCAEGTCSYLELLFSTEANQDKYSPLWDMVYDNREAFLTKKSKSFLGYCLSQSKKYGHRGDKYNIAKNIKKFLVSTHSIRKLVLKNSPNAVAEILSLGESEAYLQDIVQTSGVAITHINLFGKKIPTTGTLSMVEDVVDNMMELWGQRTITAADQSGVDWKGMMHSVRIAQEAIEYFESGAITFPRRNAEYLKKIRCGEINLDQVSEKIDRLLTCAEEAAALSSLRDQQDQETIDDLLLEIYERNRLD